MGKELQELATKFIRACKAKNFRRDVVKMLAIITCMGEDNDEKDVFRTYLKMLDQGKTEQDFINYAEEYLMEIGEQ